MCEAVGFGFGATSFFVAMTSYFEKHRDKAVGLGMALTAIGPIFYPQLITLLLKYYDANGCIMILAAIGLHIIAAALLLQPVEGHMIRATIPDEEMASLNEPARDRKLSLAPSKMSSTTSLSLPNLVGNNRKMSTVSLYAQFVAKCENSSAAVIEPTGSETVVKRGKAERAWHWLVDTFDLNLMRDMKFVYIIIGGCLSDFAEINFSMSMPFILVEQKYSSTEVADFMSVLAVADIVFRFISPYIGNFLRQSARPMFVYGLVVVIVARLGKKWISLLLLFV